MSIDRNYDIAISFAGEDREYVRALAGELMLNNLEVYFDEYEAATLWGVNLYDHLTDVYSKKASFCIMVISDAYSKKNWSLVERIAAQARAFEENREYILPLRLDSTEIPGMLTTTSYIDASDKSIEEIALLAKSKVTNLYLESLRDTPDLKFSCDSSNCFLTAVKSNDPSIKNSSAFIIYNLRIINICKRKITLVDFELNIRCDNRMISVNDYSPRLSMIFSNKKELFPREGQLLILIEPKGHAILDSWVNSRYIVTNTIDPGELLSFSLLFIFDIPKEQLFSVDFLELVVTDSWGIKHNHEFSLSNNLVHIGSFYADAYFDYNHETDRLAKIYFNHSEYPYERH